MILIKSFKLIEKIVSLNVNKTLRFINSNTFDTNIIMENNNKLKDEEKHINIDIKVDNNEEKSEDLDNNSEHQSKRLKTEDNNCSEVSDSIDNKVIVSENIIKRQKLRKWVLLLSYCGHGFYGMQRQSWDATLPTIEGQLIECLWKSGAITEEKYKSPHLARFQRAARTDKGVSAIRQIVSILLPIDFSETIPKVNELLPPQIRLISGLRVTKFFDSKNFCDGRTYSYLMPSYSICPIDQLTSQSFRVKPESIDEFNEILSIYLGTHNYHNFTAQKKPTDPSSSRYIMEIKCSQPFIKDEIEFVVVRVKGQSFMLHQIRKMIGLAIAVMRGLTAKQTIIKAFDALRLDIPIAPGLGLLLEEVHYDRYNQKYGGDGIHDAIQWDQNNELIDEFKHKYIYPVIVETEKKDMSMFQWLTTLPLHTYDVRKQESNPPLNQQVSDQIEENETDSDCSSLLRASLNAQKESLISKETNIEEKVESKI